MNETKRNEDHMIILLDLDDTVLDWSHRYDTEIREKFPLLTGIPLGQSRRAFDLWSERTEEERAAILSVMDSTGFYSRLEPIPGAVEAYHEMVADGHDVAFLSSPWYTNPTCLDDKARSVLKHFGEDALANLILTKKKWRVNGDFLFDDKDNIEKADQAQWEQIIVSGPHNQASTLPRLEKWEDWRKVLNQAILKKVEKHSDGNLAPRRSDQVTV